MLQIDILRNKVSDLNFWMSFSTWGSVEALKR